MENNSNYQVIVGNIGTVYHGDNSLEAASTYSSYVRDSKNDYGRAAGESVTMFCNDDIFKEYIGTLETEDC